WEVDAGMVRQRTGTTTEGAARGGRAASVGPEERPRVVAEAPYYRAERPGFREGGSVNDWLEAEREVDRMLSGQDRDRKAEEVAAYKRLREEIRKILGEVRETVNADTMRQAVDRAGKELREAGGYAADTVNKVVSALKKDVAGTADRVGSRWETVSGRASDVFDIWRDRSSAFLAHAAKGVADWLEDVRGKLERRTYRAGEMTYGGVFECTECGERITLDQPTHLPDCPRCRKSEYRRV